MTFRRRRRLSHDPAMPRGTIDARLAPTRVSVLALPRGCLARVVRPGTEALGLAPAVGEVVATGVSVTTGVGEEFEPLLELESLLVLESLLELESPEESLLTTGTATVNLRSIRAALPARS